MDEACGRPVRIMVQPVPREGEEVNRRESLSSAKDRGDMRERRNPKLEFGVRSSKHLELPTSNPSPSRLSRTAILCECSLVVLLDRARRRHTCRPSKFSRADIVFRSLLARIIHECFYCNRRSAATTSLWTAGSPLGPSPYCTSTPRVLTPPRARLAWRLRDFATNRHEYCGLGIPWRPRVTAQTGLKRLSKSSIQCARCSRHPPSKSVLLEWCIAAACWAARVWPRRSSRPGADSSRPDYSTVRV